MSFALAEVFTTDRPPVDGREGEGQAGPGALLTDLSQSPPKQYINTGTLEDPLWLGTSSGYPDVAGDGLTPGGLNIAGALTAGDPNAASVPSFNSLYGSTYFLDTPGNIEDEDATVVVVQNQPLTKDQSQPALELSRNGIGDFHYTKSMLLVLDNVGSGKVATFSSSSVTQFQVDGDGVQVHGKFKLGSIVTRAPGAGNGKQYPVHDEAGVVQGYVTLTA